MRTTSVPTRLLAASAVSLTLLGLLSPAARAEEPATWSTSSDGGLLADDVAQHVGVSPSPYNNPETVFVAGSAGKPAGAGAVGVSDQDVLTTAYDAATGAERWKVRFDDNLSPDRAASLEVNYNNNLVYVPVNAGNDIVTAEYAARSGDEVSRWRFTGGQANDSAISPAGGFMGVVGRSGGKLLVLSYATGQGVVELQDTPVDGEAHGADISATGSLATIRTLLVTGQSSGFGTGGDLYTVAYDYRTHTRLWARGWASAGNRADEGLLAESAHVSALGRGVGFVAGTTYSPERGFDIVVTAYDLANGAPIWSGDGTRSFDGTSSGEDVPVAMTYSDATGKLYVTGRTERGATHDQDVVTLAFDAVTGAQERVAYARGTSTNGNDIPTGITVSPDGARVFVAATVQNLLVDGSHQAALFAYDASLHPAGQRVVGADGDDRAAGVAVGLDPSRVFLAGSRRGAAAFDFSVDAFATAGFATQPVATDLVLTPSSPTAGDHSDVAGIEARLAEADGTALAGRTVSFRLGEVEQAAVTDDSGVARASFRLDQLPGAYPLTVAYAGDGPFTPSEDSTTFEVRRESTTVTVGFAGTSTRRTVTARLADADSPSAGLAGRTIAFFTNGTPIGTATTDADGVATVLPPARFRKGAYTFEARFAGDATHLASSGSAVST